MLSCVIVKYVETKFVWNEFKTNTNLDCNKSDLNTRHTLNCDSLKIFYRVNSRWNTEPQIVKQKYIMNFTVPSWAI
jgi:hypothetical protein